jgi:hypothetical protein
MVVVGVVTYLVAKRFLGINDEEMKSIGAIVVSIAVATWVVLYAFFTGAPVLDQLKLARERENYVQRIELDLGIVGLTPLSFGSGDGLRVPISITASAKNGGSRSVDLLDYKKPLLLLTQYLSGEAKDPKFGPPESLPYIKINAPDSETKFEVIRYSKGALQPGDTEYYAFFHPGVSPGFYLIQFQLAVPKDLSKLRDVAAIWTRMLYVEVTSSGKVLMPTSAAKSQAALEQSTSRES